MKKAAIAMIVLAALSLLIAGCGPKTVGGVPSTVATVNGKPIPSDQYIRDVSQLAGEQVLTNLIQQAVILQWAEDEKVAPTDKQVDRQIQMLKEQKLYDDRVKALGETGLREQMRVQQAFVNLAKQMYHLDQSDLQNAYEQNKAKFVHGHRKQVELILQPTKDAIDAAAQKLKEGRTFDSIAAASASQYGGRPVQLWVEDQAAGLPPELVAAVKDLKVGAVSPAFSFGSPHGPTQYAIAKVLQESPAENKSFQEVKTQVEDLAAMQKWQQDPDQQFAKKLNDKMRAAKIDINMSQFKQIANTINNPQEVQQRPAMRPMPQPQPKK